jgi:isoleucyl-tRNA synthetase
LRELSGHKGDFDLHRPGIDAVVIEKDGKVYRRAEEVFDCWFESGAMPYAQDHYPFEHQDQFKDAFPAQFIAEGLDQTRGWFYTLHVLGTALFDKPAYQNVVVNGMVLAADGKKLSKRLRNYPEPEEIFGTTGADSLRFFLMSSPVVSGEDVRFGYDAVNEVRRNVFMTLWNTYSFLSTYAEIDRWQPQKKLEAPTSTNVLDEWLLARLNETLVEMTKQADDYQIARAVRPLRDLVDDLSNWYVRRSRRRFWKSENDTDKEQAFRTLHYVLCRIAQMLAPWAPFLSDKLWGELTEGMDEARSVHLSDWPEAGKVDPALVEDMARVRDYITEALSQRSEHKIKVRQPLSKVKVPTITKELAAIVADEVNVKEVVVSKGSKVEIDTQMTPELKAEGLMRDVVRLVQAERKKAGLEVDDRIVLTLDTDDKVLAKAIKNHVKVILAETLAKEFNSEGPRDQVPVRVDGAELYVGVRKAQ